MKVLCSILCALVLSFGISYAYEEIPADAKSHTEDVSKQMIASQAPAAKSRMPEWRITSVNRPFDAYAA